MRKIVKWMLCVVAVLCTVLLVLLLALFRGAIYNRYVSFPREVRAWEQIRAARTEVAMDDGWTDYRGVCHSHSELSHDSLVPFPEILRVLKETDRQFICISDHCVNGEADYSIQWKGVKDGVLFVPGFEMSGGFMPWGLPPETTLDCGEDPETLAAEIEAKGGLLFYAHPEEPRRWDLPELDGMEIYNIHADQKDEDIKTLVPDLLLNRGRFPDQCFRLIFDRNTTVLQHWDELSIGRKLSGIAANDCHQNVGIFGVWHAPDTLSVHPASGKKPTNYRCGPLKRLLLRVCCGPLEDGRQILRFQVDPYETMVRYVATHLLMKELSEAALLDALRTGRAYIAFDMIADATGFIWMAGQGASRAVMGETMDYAPGTLLRAASPCACRFTVLRHGVVKHQSEGMDLEWEPGEPGKYRVEAELNIRDEWVPWVYTNPIELK